MNEVIQENEQVNAIFPRSVLTVSREEFGDQESNINTLSKRLPLIIKEGTIPNDIQGHVFIVGPVGSVDSPHQKESSSIVSPCLDGTTLLYNGDGMIYRLDFDNLDEGVFLATQMVKTPSYYADLATNKCQEYHGTPGSKTSPDLRFYNLGITRISGTLGSSNQLNTAFLPVKFAEDENERLLVTWDAGRPYEIDPKTLETVTPVGRNDEWDEVSSVYKLFFKPPAPFKIIQTSAHPVFDPYKNKGEMFTVNCGRSLTNILSQLIPIGYLFEEAFQPPEKKKKRILLEETEQPPATYQERPTTTLSGNLKKIWQQILQFVKAFIGIFTDNFVDLVCWNGSGDFVKWKVLHHGLPISINQSTHQIGLTEDYIILVDTAFKISVEELLPSTTKEDYKRLEKWSREVLDQPQLSDNPVYIIHRSELKPGRRFVNAKKVTIPGEAAHFLVDYRNPNGQITLHFSHVCAWDAAECISEFDFDDNDSLKSVSQTLQRLYGVLFGPVDISRLGCYVINGETGEFVRKDQDILMDLDYTWGPAISTYRTTPFPDRLEDIYWGCLGCWEELLMPHIVRLYKNYKYRQVDIPKLQEITKQGKSSNIFRVHIAPLESVKEEENRLQIPDGYEFPDGYYVTSPQFVPAKDKDGSTDGYIVCIVHYGDGTEESNGNEIWIFDAANLKSGPKCKLWHPKLNIGFTVHATWMQKIEGRTAKYNIDVQEDYQPLIDAQPKNIRPLIQDLFDQWVYPKRESL